MGERGITGQQPEGTGWLGAEDLEWSDLLDHRPARAPDEVAEEVRHHLGIGARRVRHRGGDPARRPRAAGGDGPVSRSSLKKQQQEASRAERQIAAQRAARQRLERQELEGEPRYASATRSPVTAPGLAEGRSERWSP